MSKKISDSDNYIYYSDGSVFHEWLEDTGGAETTFFFENGKEAHQYTEPIVITNSERIR